MSELIDPAALTPSPQSRRILRVLSASSIGLRGLRLATPRNVRVLRRSSTLMLLSARRGRPGNYQPVRERTAHGWVRGEWVGGRPAPGTRIVYYLHGSGYVMCSPRTHRAFVGYLGHLCARPAFTVQYRLAPEHRFPRAHEDAVNGYLWLLEQGFEARDIIVAGDSAGGHLAFALCGELRRRALPQPAGILAFSPLVDPTWETAAREERSARDPFVTAATARAITALYTAGSDPHDPRLDVIRDVGADLPPMLIQTGGREVLAADARAYAAAQQAAGGRCELQIWPGQIHVFQVAGRFLPEARIAMRHVQRFVRDLDAEVGVATTLPDPADVPPPV